MTAPVDKLRNFCCCIANLPGLVHSPAAMTIKAPRAPLQLTTAEDQDDVLGAACDRESLVLIELVMSGLDARGRSFGLPKMISMRPARRVPRHAAARVSAYLLKPQQQQNMQNGAEIYT